MDWKFFVVVVSLGFILKFVLFVVVVVLLSEETKKAPQSLKWQIILIAHYCPYFSWPSTALLQPDQGAAVMSRTTAGLPPEHQVLRSHPVFSPLLQVDTMLCPNAPGNCVISR